MIERELEPAAEVVGFRDPVDGKQWPPKPTTTAEQEREAIRYALEEMRKANDWRCDLIVRWTRREPTVLVLRGHAEHLEGKVVPVLSAIEDERTMDGRPVRRDAQHRYERLVSEVQSLDAENDLADM